MRSTRPAHHGSQVVMDLGRSIALGALGWGRKTQSFPLELIASEQFLVSLPNLQGWGSVVSRLSAWAATVPTGIRATNGHRKHLPRGFSPQEKPYPEITFTSRVCAIIRAVRAHRLTGAIIPKFQGRSDEEIA